MSKKELQERLDKTDAALRDHEDLLKHLLVLDPSLDRFRIEVQRSNGWGSSWIQKEWDLQGIKEAAVFRQQEAQARKYAPHNEVGKKTP